MNNISQSTNTIIILDHIKAAKFIKLCGHYLFNLTMYECVRCAKRSFCLTTIRRVLGQSVVPAFKHFERSMIIIYIKAFTYWYASCGMFDASYDGRKVTTYTTHQWYVVLEVFCVVYVGKPPTTHVGGVKWYVVLEVFCVVYVGKPPTTHVGGVKWYVVLEVFCVVYVGKPPTRHVGGVKWYLVLEVFCVVYVGKPPTRHVGGVKWYVVLEVYRHIQHKIPPTRHAIGVSCM